MSDKKKYKNPKPKDKEFSKYWKRCIPIISKKDGFNEIGLKNLEILCSLYVNHDYLSNVLNEEGWHIVNEGRYGTQIKSHPVAGERAKITAEIRQYSRMLGVKISEEDGGDDKEGAEWSM